MLNIITFGVFEGCEINSGVGTAQRDSIVMAIYPVAVILLLLVALETVSAIHDFTVKVDVYADNFIDGRTIEGLKHCRDTLSKLTGSC